MSSPNDFSLEGSRTRVPIRCKCGQAGIMVWENDQSSGRAEPYLITMSPNFYERIKKADQRTIEVVCRSCGAVRDLFGLHPRSREDHS
jgi:hypothetical protein